MAQNNLTTVNDLVFPFKNYVLALPGWYPTWIDPLPGDFNQRHIVAASQHVPQIVLYVGKDFSGTLTKTTVRYNQLSKFVIEVLVVYPKRSVEFIDGVQSNVNFFHLLNKHAVFIRKRWGKPKLLHSYIVVRGGVAGYLLSKRWKLPLMLTENWTIYYPNDPGYLFKRKKLFRWTVKKVFASLTMFLPVTDDLNKRAKALAKNVPSTVIPNVVDIETFFPGVNQKVGGGFKFIHVSTMIYQKNPQGLLRGFKAVYDQQAQATLLMVGPYPEDVKFYATQLGFTEKTVRFTGAVDHKKVAELLQASDALVLFSRYENLPCVILEALCCGLPVISTRVGGIAEVINADNGILVESDDENELSRSFAKMMVSYQQYNVDNISNNARAKYSYEAVGNKLKDVYSNVINIS